jgi:hypothetical protein
VFWADEDRHPKDPEAWKANPDKSGSHGKGNKSKKRPLPVDLDNEEEDNVKPN